MRQTGTNVCEAGGKSCRVRARTESELVRSVLLVAAVGILALPPTHISGPRREGAAGSGVTSGGAGRGGAPASGQLVVYIQSTTQYCFGGATWQNLHDQAQESPKKVGVAHAHRCQCQRCPGRASAAVISLKYNWPALHLVSHKLAQTHIGEVCWKKAASILANLQQRR